MYSVGKFEDRYLHTGKLSHYCSYRCLRSIFVLILDFPILSISITYTRRRSEWSVVPAAERPPGPAVVVTARCRCRRLSERVLAAVPPMSKEERRRAFAEAAAAADESRRRSPPFRFWGDGFAPVFPLPPNLLLPVLDEARHWPPPRAPFFPPFAPPQALCVPPHK